MKVQYEGVGWITRKNVGFQPYIMVEMVEMMEMKKYIYLLDKFSAPEICISSISLLKTIR